MYNFIVIKTREETKKKIDEVCNEIYNKKLEVFNIIAERQQTDDRKFKLYGKNYILTTKYKTSIKEISQVMNCNSK